MRAALYVRVSSEEQRLYGYSIDSQLDALRTYCEYEKITIADIYNDAGISARKSYKKRPELLRMIEDAKEKKFDLILITKLDRFFRNVGDYYEVTRSMGDIPWKAIHEDYETETASGRFKVNLFLAVGQDEADRTSERIKATNKYRREHGKLLSGSMPLGYINVNHHPEMDPNTREGVAAFFRTYLTGKGTKEACLAALEYGVVITQPHAVRMLKGADRYAGRIQNIECEAYISKEDAEKILSTRYQGRAKKNIYCYAGVTFCGSCGHAYSGNTTYKNCKDGRRDYISYRCHHKYVTYGVDRCQSPPIKEELLEELFMQKVDALIYDVRVESVKNEANKEEQRRTLEARKNTIAQRKKRAYQAFIGGIVEEAEFIEERDKLDRELFRVESDLKQMDRGPEKVLATFPDDWKEAYKQLTRDEKREFLYKTISRITVNMDKSIDVSFRI